MKTKSLSFMGFLLSAVLVSSMFLVGTTISEFPNGSPGEYSPWGDLNDDGKMDIFDLVWMDGRYGTTGIPSKNVNVTNWPESWLAGTVNVTNWQTWMTDGASPDFKSTLFLDKPVLVGGYTRGASGAGEGVLFMDDTPRPYLEDVYSVNLFGDSNWHEALNVTFTQIEYAKVQYNVTGTVIGNLRIGVYNTNINPLTMQVRGTITVGNKSQGGSTLSIYTETLSPVTVGPINNYLKGYFSRTYSGLVNPPMPVNIGERIFVRIYLEASANVFGGQVGVIYNASANDLMTILAVSSP